MNIDPEKLLVVFVIALIVLGPNRLPQAARSLGRGLAELRKYTSAVRTEVDQVLAEPRAIIQSAVYEADLRPGMPFSPNSSDAQGVEAGPGTTVAEVADFTVPPAYRDVVGEAPDDQALN